ncbi:MAG: T9SS type A sorting domain-containing protein [Chitinispirillaceae bacterium]|jgi:alpha-glucuronidase
MSRVTNVRFLAFCFAVIALAANTVIAYTGSDAFLHYYAAPASVKTQYQSVCVSLLVSDTTHDTLKHAVAEFDTAIPKLLGGSKLPRADGTGAIVLAEQGSSLVSSAGIDYSGVTAEGFIIKTISGKTYITSKSQVGVLRGAFRFLRLMQTQKNINNLNIIENPYFTYRVHDHWYNHYGTGPDAERLYGGLKAFQMADFGNLTGAELTRVINYCRMAASLGLNGMCPDNVNTYQSGGLANYKCLEAANLKNEKAFADLIGTYGLKYYLSVNYSSPLLVTPIISTADAYNNATAKQWWFNKVDTIRAYIKNFGGFLLKADSEGEPGPRSTYGETQSQGANPLAQALDRYGLICIWRTFIYGTVSPDFAIDQSQEFQTPAQTWDTGIVIRMKDGPRDFQMIEPPHQLFGMSGCRHGMEFQVTHEYTGQAIHLDWLVPKWKKVLNWNMVGAPTWNGASGTVVSQLLQGSGSRTGGVWGIGNLSDTVNWTGHFLCQADYYGFGRLAWNPNLSADTIADEWIRCSVDSGYNYGLNYVVSYMLNNSWRAYTEYTIGHGALMPALENNNHYPISYAGMHQSSFYTDYFMNLTADGIGVDRTSAGDNFLQYFSSWSATLADSFNTLTKCPEDYILFFHHLTWPYVMKGGMTLIQQLEFEHFHGIHMVQKFIRYWKLIQPNIDATIYAHVLSKLNQQLTDASTWACDFRADFGNGGQYQGNYATQVPCHLDIITPDTTKATTAAAGANVNLSAWFRTQGTGTTTGGWANGTVVTGETFNWSVSPGATLTASTGASTVFSASAPGIYKVTLSDSKWPNQTEEELIFVGSWMTGVKTESAKPSLLPLKITQGPHRIVIISPVAGKISIVSLQGRVVKSVLAGKAVPVVWDTRGVAKGLYLLKVQNETQTLESKFFVQ